MDIIKYNGTEVKPRSIKTMRVVVGVTEYKIKEMNGGLMITTAKNGMLTINPFSVNAFRVDFKEDED